MPGSIATLLRRSDTNITKVSAARDLFVMTAGHEVPSVVVKVASSRCNCPLRREPGACGMSRVRRKMMFASRSMAVSSMGAVMFSVALLWAAPGHAMTPQAMTHQQKAMHHSHCMTQGHGMMKNGGMSHDGSMMKKRGGMSKDHAMMKKGGCMPHAKHMMKKDSGMSGNHGMMKKNNDMSHDSGMMQKQGSTSNQGGQ
ncbi:MAG TPA: hypothetical protein VF271_11905 [Rhodanobacteraceae bacterium]